MGNWRIGIVSLGLLLGSEFNSLPAIARSPLPSQTAQATNTSICPAQLPGAIDAIINRPQFRRSRWGILISPQAQGGQALYSREAQRYFLPASNAKLLTTAAALHRLGGQFRIRTVVSRLDAPTGQTRLLLTGRGDPSLTDKELNNLALQLQRQGIQQINELIVDDSYFQQGAVNPNWEWGDLQVGYGAAVNSLIVNGNAIGLTLTPQQVGQPLRVTWDDSSAVQGWQVDNQSTTVAADAPESLDVGRDFSRPVLRLRGQLRVGAAPEPLAIAVSDPSQHFLNRWRRALSAQSIQVDRLSLATSSLTPGTEVAAIASPPLSTLLQETNQQSNNLYAEALLRSLGRVQSPNNPAVLETGLAALKTTLTSLGVTADGYRLADGSGLSRHNLISPEALVQVLQAMARSPQAGIYRSSLPVAGVSGTLSNRFRGTVAQGVVQAKTGTLSDTFALSGYVNNPNYSPLTFSILANQSEQPSATVRQAIDAIVVLLAQLRSC